jgi:formylglycine-generating enzyme required for sulfatase activity
MKFKQSLPVIFVCGLFAQMPLSIAAETIPAPSKAAGADLDDTLWGVAERANTVDDYQVYLDSFPQGKYVPFAKSRIKRLQATSQPAVTASGKVVVEPVMVSIPGKDFEIGKYEVTQKEWRAIMGDNPSYFQACGDNCPLEQVSWTDAKKFIAKLNQRSEKEYRLPTEDEWLDACAGGSAGGSCGGNEMAWHAANSGGATHPVGQQQPNGYGLYDMSGNVAEWGSDEWASSSESAVGVVIVGSLGKRALLGGDYDTKLGETRGIDRRGLVQATRDRHIGFRLARTLK